MKRILTIPLLLLSTLLLTFPLCACDDEEQLTLPDDNTAQVTYTVGDLKDLFQLSDVTVTYRDASGALQSETLTESAWTKTLTDVAVPFSPFMVVSYRTKEGVVLDKASYSFSRNFAIRVQTGASVSNNSSIYIEKTLGPTLTQRELMRLEQNPDTLSCHIGQPQ